MKRKMMRKMMNKFSNDRKKNEETHYPIKIVF
jgi:hypothetical protein